MTKIYYEHKFVAVTRWTLILMVVLKDESTVLFEMVQQRSLFGLQIHNKVYVNN